MTSYTAFLWVFVQTVSGKRASDTFVKLLEAQCAILSVMLKVKMYLYF